VFVGWEGSLNDMNDETRIDHLKTLMGRHVTMEVVREVVGSEGEQITFTSSPSLDAVL
jgi:hypothetical protein